MQEYYLQLNFLSDCFATSGFSEGGVVCHAEIYSLHSGWPHCADVVEVLNSMAWILVDGGLLYDLALSFLLLMLVSLHTGAVV